MPIPLAIPIVGGLVLATGTVLALRAKKAKEKAGVLATVQAVAPGGTAPQTAVPKAAAVSPFVKNNPSGSGLVLSTAPVITGNTSVAEAAAKLGLTKDDAPLRPGTRSPTMDELMQQLRDPANFARNHPDIDFASQSVEQQQAAFDAFTARNPEAAAGTGAIPGTLVSAGSGATTSSVASVGQQAVVTTNDAPPSGDLRVFATASTAQQIGGADKNGVVTILDSSDPTFALINWTGGRNPPVQGFAKKQFLRNV